MVVVDDVGAIRMLVGHILHRLGIDTQEAATGESGLALAREHAPDLIILDLVLPGISGLETLQALKADPETRDIPVVLLTALSGSEQANEAMEAGAVGLIGKPFTIDQIRAVLDEWVGVEEEDADPSAGGAIDGNAA